MQVTYVIVLLSLVTRTLGYSSGAAASACSTLRPSHDGETPQEGPHPYNIEIDVDTYHPGESIEGTNVLIY